VISTNSSRLCDLTLSVSIGVPQKEKALVVSTNNDQGLS